MIIRLEGLLPVRRWRPASLGRDCPLIHYSLEGELASSDYFRNYVAG